jgi:hypothetical protein
MSTGSDARHVGTKTQNRHRVLDKVTFITCAIFLTVQVIEGALTVPLILVYYGFPQVGIQKICAELYNIAYGDDKRKCEYPYPLFFEDFAPEPSHYESKDESVTPPHTHHRVPGWREMITIVEGRQAAAKAANEVMDHE